LRMVLVLKTIWFVQLNIIVFEQNRATQKANMILVDALRMVLVSGKI
jgi:hypothetical protein